MAAAKPTIECPTCGAPTRPHCDVSRTCNWRVCPNCHHFGVPGGRWVEFSPKKSA